MARPGIEFKSVERVARQLLSKGQHPSVQRVRGILGTGSNTTIARHLKHWQHAFSQSLAPTLPASVPEDLMVPLDDFWNTAVARADANYQKYKDNLDTKVTAAELNEANAILQLEKKSSEYDALQQELIHIKQKLRNTEQQHHTLQGKYSVLSSEIVFVHHELDSTFTLMKDLNSEFEIEREKSNASFEKLLQYERDTSIETEKKLLNKIDHLKLSIKSKKIKEQIHQNKLHKINENKHQHELVMLQEIMDLSNKNQQIENERKQYLQSIGELKQQLISNQQILSKSMETIESLSQVNQESKNSEILLLKNIGSLKDFIANLKLNNSN